ncbi:MAG: phosphoenolpyruvate synthase [Thermomicrobiales bacterium]
MPCLQASPRRQGLTPIIEKEPRGEREQAIYGDNNDGATTTMVATTDEERSRFVLQDDEILQLARWAIDIERHYGRPMDIEWARDGQTGDLYIVQAWPETVESRRDATSIRTYDLKEKGSVLMRGLAIGSSVAAGKIQVIERAGDIGLFEPGSILVTEMTDPDWVPALRRAAGIITDHGGRTCHAAIVSRELGIPAIVGTGHASSELSDGQEVTMSCIGDEGTIYEGIPEYEESEEQLDDVPETRTRIMINIASPAASLRWWKLPSRGIGLARMEFIINNHIKIHPMALIHPDKVDDDSASEQIAELTRAYDDKQQYFVERLALGIAKIATPHYPHPVIVRMSDFKTNEYADLIGGRAFEPEEANPMLGFRGASRYYDERYREGFALECAAIRRVREQIGLDNVIVMIPFCRTVEEADRVLEVMAEHGLVRGKDGLEVYVMAEIPSNIVLASEFAERFDGFSIGSNDLTQLVLGIDRDSSDLAHLFDERNDAVKRMIVQLIVDAHASNTPVGICGEAPSNYPEFAEFLVEAGIDSMSLSPDSVIDVLHRVAAIEQKQGVPAREAVTA